MRRTEIASLLFLSCLGFVGWSGGLAPPARGEPAGPPAAGGVPDQAVVLRVAENGRAQLSFLNAANGLSSFEFQRQGDHWNKAGNVPVESLLGLRVGDNAQWQQVFGSPYPRKAIDWSRFWNGWLDRLQRLQGDDLLRIPGGGGEPRQVLLQRVGEPEWRSRFAQAMPVLLGRAAPAPPAPAAASGTAAGSAPAATEATHLAGSPVMTSNLPGGAGAAQGSAGSLAWLLEIAAALAVAGVAAWRFRGWIETRWRAWRSRASAAAAAPATTPQAEVVVLAEVLDRLHRAAADILAGEPPQPADAAALGSQALAFALGRYRAAAEAAGILRHRVAAEAPPAGEETPDQAERAGQGPRQPFSDRRGKRDKDKLAALSEDLKRERKRTEQLETARQDLAAKVDDLEQEKRRLSDEVRELAGYKQQRIEGEQRINELYTSQRKLKKELEEAQQHVATTAERQREALAARQREIQTMERDYRRDLAEKKGKVESLSTELAGVQRELAVAAVRVKNLESELDRERRKHDQDDADLRVFREKMDRVGRASDFLRRAQLGYWDRCQHPSSTAAVLYSSYLGLYQALAGAFQKQALQENAGWTNVWNLLQRLAEVPGLDRWPQEFARGVCPEIEKLQLEERQIVDSKRQDKEQFVQSMVLQGLFTGEVQLDGDRRERFSLDRMRRWPLYFRVEGEQVWGAV